MRRLVRLLPHASLLPALLAVPAWGAEFQLVPTLNVAQYYSDNVALAPEGQEVSDWVTQVRPGVLFTYNGARIKFFATAAAELLYRNREGSTEVNPQYNGGTVGSAELVEKLLYLDTTSSVSQQAVSVLRPVSYSSVNTDGNRATTQTTLLSPYLRYSFGSEVDTEARYAYTIVNTDAVGSGATDSTGNRVALRAVSGPAYRLTRWHASYVWENIDYDNRLRESRSERALVGVRRLVTPVVGLVANVGYEDYNYVTTGQSPSGLYWNAGLDWTPSPRTQLTALAGRRFYGRTYALTFNHRTRLTVWNLGYSEDITSYREQALVHTSTSTAAYLDALYTTSIPNPVERRQAVERQIAEFALPPTLLVPVNFLTNRTYLDKSWRGSVGMRGARHALFANVFFSDRVAESVGLPGDFAAFSPGSTVRQRGGSLVWNWRVTTLGSTSLGAGYTRYETPSAGRDDQQTYFRLAYNHVFTPRMSGAVNYQRLQNDSNVANSNYTENQVSAHLQLRF
ncbi:MAG: TIGR03016 family PEP-CTERM system-associated outer membrane protein [Burkholderiales bacterium]|nr:TIGR03016 family PEP-CTERM system-associated outer membrane protein [Burkholderiales bacterium]